MAYLRILAGVILAGLPLAAQAAPEPDEVAQLLGGDGRDVSWQGAAQEEAALQLSGFALQAGDLVLRAQSAVFARPQGAADGPMQVTLHGGSVAPAQAFEGGGRIEMRQAMAPDARVLTGISALHGAGIDCVAPPAGSSQAGLSMTVELDDVVLQSSGAMLPRGLDAERLAGARMELDLLLNPAVPACGLATRLEVGDLALVAADGSTAEASALELSRVPGDDLGVTAELRALVARDAQGRRLMEAGRLAVQADLSAAALTALQQGAAAGDPIALLDALFLDPDAPVTRARMDLDALYLPVGMLLPGEIRAGASIDAADELTGDIMLDAEFGPGRLTLIQQVALQGLMHSSGRLVLSADADGGSRAFDMILGGDAPLGGLTAVQLSAFEFAFEDDGVGRMVEAATGRAVPQHVATGSDAMTAGVPGPLRDGVASVLEHVADWSAQAMTHGAQVRLNPESPVGVAQIGMTLLRNPDALGDVLGLQAP